MVTRLRTWLFVVSVLAVLFGPVVVGISNHMLDAQFQTIGIIPIQSISATTEPGNPSQPACIPIVGQVAYDELDKLIPDQEYDPIVSLRMAGLFAADQAARQLPVNDAHKTNADDTV
jgi:hypothetical protein